MVRGATSLSTKEPAATCAGCEGVKMQAVTLLLYSCAGSALAELLASARLCQYVFRVCCSQFSFALEHLHRVQCTAALSHCMCRQAGRQAATARALCHHGCR